MLKHLDLFAGIGGFSLAAKMMNYKTIAWVERDKFCQHVLRHYFPDAIGHDDIDTTDFTCYANTIDIVTGGFPCQPFSGAGKRQGTGDARYKWPTMYRAIKECGPRWIVPENVRGLIDWSTGLVFETVQADLADAGYEACPLLLPASGVEAPHTRYRIWIVAHAHGKSQPNGPCNETQGCGQLGRIATDTDRIAGRPGPQSQNGEETNNCSRFTDATGAYPGHFSTESASTYPHGQQRPKRRLYADGQQQAGRHPGPFDPWDFWNPWENFPTQSPVRTGDDGIPARLDTETIRKITGKKRRPVSRWATESLKAGGNAIVPQVAVQIFKAIELYEQLNYTT